MKAFIFLLATMIKHTLTLFACLVVLLLRSNCLAHDWADLKHFKTENTQAGILAKGEKRVVFMGNSITEAWSRDYPYFYKNKPYCNCGISGQTTPQMLLRFRQDVIKLEPAVVVILAGTNDIEGNTGFSTLEMIEDNIISMVELAKANRIQVVLCSVLPVFDYPWKPGIEPAQKIVALNNLLKKYAQNNKVIYLDFFTAMVDKRNGLKDVLTFDGVHPNVTGYQLMSPLAEEAIGKAFKKK